MNLTKLFHFNYLKQNLKKSRVTLSFVLLILPVLNLLIFFMQTDNSRINVFSLEELSPLTTLMLYVIPVVLSIILFSYLFKKKSIDFIGSMPLDRKTIFVTNTIGGILLIIALIFITAFLVFITSIFLPHVYIPLGALIDYFVLFSLSYIFVFVVCNLALSLAGNIPTTIILTVLILFLVPFVHITNQTTKENYNNNYYYQCSNCHNQKHLTGINEEIDYHYTTPSQVMISTLTYNEESSLYKDSALGKMALLTILYMLVGFSTFNKKELEVSETSFKNKWHHQIVKSLTLVPVMIIVYQIIEDSSSFIALLFVLALLLVYYFVYDLITKKSITNIRFNIISFLITVIVLFSFSALVLNKFTSAKDIILKEKDVTSVTFFNTNIDILDGIGGNFETDDKEIIDLVLTSNGDRYISEVVIKIGGKKYRKALILSEEKVTELEKLIAKTKEFNNKKDNILEDALVVTISSNQAKLEDMDLEILRKAIKNPVDVKNEFFLPLYLYTYQNHVLTKQTYYSNLNEELNQLAVDRYNKVVKDKLKGEGFNNIRWLNIYNEYTGEFYYNLKLKYQDLFNLLKVQTTSVHDKLYRVEFSSNDTIYYYYTNLDSDAKKMLELDEVSDEKKEEAIEFYVN